MRQDLFFGAIVGAAVAFCSAASAATVSPVFVDAGIDTTGTATSTRMYRADLTVLGLTELASVKITDSNSKIGGSSGIYSGFDLDAIFLDVDGLLTTIADRIFAVDFLFSAGTIRPGSFPPPSPSGGPTNGSSSATSVDEAWATLGDIDGIFFDQGSLTLGDGGTLTAIFDPKVLIGSSMFLFVGEVSGDAGETVTGLIEVSDTPPPIAPIPLPASLPLLLSGMIGLGWLARRKGSR
jgi:hypothetical protein